MYKESHCLSTISICFYCLNLEHLRLRIFLQLADIRPPHEALMSVTAKSTVCTGWHMIAFDVKIHPTFVRS